MLKFFFVCAYFIFDCRSTVMSKLSLWSCTPPLFCRQWFLLEQPAAVIGQSAADKKWDVPGKIANRKGRPEPKKKKKKKKKTAAAAAADETSERRKSIVSQTTWHYRRWWGTGMLSACWSGVGQLITVFGYPLSNFVNRSDKSGFSRNVHQTGSREATSF